MSQIQVRELSRKVGMGRDGGQIVREFWITPYDKYPDFVARVLGYIYFSNGQFGRVQPMFDPLQQNYFAESCEVDGLVFCHDSNSKTNFTQEYQLTNTNLYTEGTVKVTYKTNTFTNEQWTSNNEGILVGLTWQFSSQQLTLPNEFYAWVNSSTINVGQSGINAVKTLPKANIQVVRYYCINRPLTAINQLQGKVNAIDIQFQDVIFPAGTMLFTSAAILEKTTYNDVKYYEITYKFDIQTIADYYATGAETIGPTGIVTTPCTTTFGYVGWNRYYRPDRGYWDEVQSTIGSKKPYLLDSEVTQTINGGTVTGFNLLTDPGAT